MLLGKSGTGYDNCGNFTPLEIISVSRKPFVNARGEDCPAKWFSYFGKPLKLCIGFA
jgi:hypothetical protein